MFIIFFLAISVGYIILVAIQMIIFYINLRFLLTFNLNRFIRWKTCFGSSCGENGVVESSSLVLVN